MTEEQSKMNMEDHNLLVALHTSAQLNFEQIRKDIAELKDNTTNRISSLEDNVESLKLWRSWLAGAIVVGGLVVCWLVPQMVAHLNEDSGDRSNFNNLKTEVENYITKHP
jgi:hypothetical protein